MDESDLDEFAGDIDPFADDLDTATMIDKSTDDDEKISSQSVSLSSQGNADDNDDPDNFINAPVSPAPSLTAEAVSENDDQVNNASKSDDRSTVQKFDNETDNRNPVPATPPLSDTLRSDWTLTTELLTLTPQTLADKLAVLLEVPLVADKESVPMSGLEQWRYNYRIAHESVSIRLFQVSFDDNTLELRIPFNRKHLLKAPDKALRLNILHKILQALGLGELGYYHNQLTLIPKTAHHLVVIAQPVLVISVNSGHINYTVTQL